MKVKLNLMEFVYVTLSKSRMCFDEWMRELNSLNGIQNIRNRTMTTMMIIVLHNWKIMKMTLDSYYFVSAIHLTSQTLDLFEAAT